MTDKILEAIKEFQEKGYDTDSEDMATEVVSLTLPNQMKPLNGFLRILKNKETGRCRIILRRIKVYTVHLNHFVNPSISFSLDNNKNQFIYDTVDYAEDKINGKKLHITFTFPPSRKEQFSAFKEKFEAAQKINQELNNSANK